VSGSPFDQLADQYDAEFTRTALGRVLRDFVWSRTDAIFAAGGRILELGCGTGEDAVRFAQRGVQVVATDAAKEMIAIARHKAERNGVVARIELRTIKMEEVPAQLQGQSFDGVFSNFGAVNCAADLPSLVGGIASLLKSGAPLLWVVMGKHVPWEWLWYLSRGQGRKAFRHYRHGVEWRGLTVKYPTPGDLRRMLNPHFGVRSVSPLGCILPPSYAGKWLERSPRSLAVLKSVEGLTRRSSRLASIADHYILEAYRL